MNLPQPVRRRAQPDPVRAAAVPDGWQPMDSARGGETIEIKTL
jgi:hypothetical protein